MPVILFKFSAISYLFVFLVIFITYSWVRKSNIGAETGRNCRFLSNCMPTMTMCYKYS